MIPKHNAKNERMKRKYFSHMKEAGGYSESTVNAAAKAVDRFEHYNKYRDFREFHIEQAIGFKNHLSAQNSERLGAPLSKVTLHSTLTQLKRFFHWLASEPGFRSRLSHSDAEYFNLSEGYADSQDPA